MEIHTIGAQKRIALVAHDNRKETLVNWVQKNEKVLSRHFLCGTGTTARLIIERTGLPVKAYRSGPLGGDQKIGSLIAELGIDLLIFFWDPLTSQPHDPDVKALLRIAVLYNIPVAMDQATADFLLSSKYMEQDYDREIQDFKI
jgi:methylglyoxal synthase